MFISGILSICQVTFLPGYILLRLLGATDGIIKTSLFSFALSLIINHIIVIILTVTGYYNRTTLLCLVVIELLTLCWSTRDLLNRRLSFKCSELKSSILPTGSRQNLKFIGYSSAVALSYYFFQFISNIGNVFDGWDPVMSWNRWAIDWYYGHLPKLMWHYPQLLPSNWSLTYIFLGTCEIQFFATAIMPLFPLLSLLTFYDLWKRNKGAAYGYAVSVLALLYVACLQLEINLGYADYPAAFMSSMAIYALLLQDNRNPTKYTLTHVILGTIICAGAALTKQAGLYLVGIYPLLCYLFVLSGMNVLAKRQKIYVSLVSGLVLVALVAPWYVFIDYRIRTGAEQSEVPYVTNDIYQGAGIISRSATSLITIYKEARTNIELFFSQQHHGVYIVYKSVTVIGLSLFVYFIYRGSRERIPRLLLVLVAIPFYVIWTLYFSYGIRNLALILPIMGVIAGHGIAAVNFGIFKKLFPNRKLQHITD